MTGAAWMAYLRARTRLEHPSYDPEQDPQVEMYNGYARIYDRHGESCMLKMPLPHQLRALATQLLLTADEIERRSFEP